MRKEILFILIGAVLFTGLSWFIDEGVRHSDYEEVGKVNGILDHTLDPELMIFGTSAGENGIDPQILQQLTGLSTFNSCIIGSRFQQYEGLLREFSTYSKNCKLILLAETFGSFERRTNIMAPEFFAAQLSRPQIYDYLYRTNPALIWKCRYVPLYKYTAVKSLYYHNSIRGWKNIFNRKKQGDPMQGFFPIDQQWSRNAEKSMHEFPAFKVEVDEELVARYRQTLESLKASGRKVVIILMPMYYEFFHTKTDLGPLRSKLQQVSRETGIPFLDFSEHEISKKKELYFNNNHLNRTGATEFSKILADSLKPRI